MIVGDGAGCVKAAEIILVRVIEAVSGSDIKWGMVLLSCEKTAIEFFAK